MKSILFVLVLSITSLSAQTTIGVISGINYRGDDNSSYAFNYSPSSWHNGNTFGLQTDFTVTGSLAFRGTVEYSRYTFSTFTYVGAAPPEYGLGSYHGDNSQSYRGILEAVYAIHISRYFTPILMTGLGYEQERNGDLWFTLVDDINHQQIDYHISGPLKETLFHSIGIGVQIYLTSYFGIEVLAKSISNYSEVSSQSLNMALLVRID